MIIELAARVWNSYEMHHANWPRRQWQKYPDFAVRSLRNHAGLILPALPPNHQLLHFDLEPTPMPLHEVADNVLEEIGKSHEVTDRIGKFKDAATFLIEQAMGNPSPEYADNARRLGTHYVAQLGYLALDEEVAAASLSEWLRCAI